MIIFGQTGPFLDTYCVFDFFRYLIQKYLICILFRRFHIGVALNILKHTLFAYSTRTLHLTKVCTGRGNPSSACVILHTNTVSHNVRSYFGQ